MHHFPEPGSGKHIPSAPQLSQNWADAGAASARTARATSMMETRLIDAPPVQLRWNACWRSGWRKGWNAGVTCVTARLKAFEITHVNGGLELRQLEPPLAADHFPALGKPANADDLHRFGRIDPQMVHAL